MCGIVGYVGRREAQPILYHCLSRLEYRGYDSCGVAVCGKELKVYKDAVRVKVLESTAPKAVGAIGIGHTRWATHGEPSRINAHPHCDCHGRIAVVHNGIIQNYRELKQLLSHEGHNFVSETDTEVIPHLIEKYYQGDLEKAVQAALRQMVGSYAVIVMAAGEPRLVVARRESPLVIGKGDRENFIASDVPAVLDYTDQVVYLEDDDIATVGVNAVRVKRQGREVVRGEHKIAWNVEDAQKGGYEHFMLKEIHEQPKVIRDTLNSYISAGSPIASFGPPGESNLENILILACGTSYHAGLLGKYVMQELFRLPVRVELASEFSYHGQAPARTKAIVITQSGETADVLKAMKKLKEIGCGVIAITNVMYSSAARMADQVIYTGAGPEMSVAATKSFLAQLIALYWLALPYSRSDTQRLDSLVTGLRQLPVKVQEVLDDKAVIIECAKKLAQYDHVFYIGRGMNFPIALEGALKLKEISYIHAEGYAAGELKHGPFALLCDRAPVVAITSPGEAYEPMLTCVKEVKARHSPLIALAQAGDEAAEKLADMVITIPSVDPLFAPVVNTVALQLLAYYAAKERGCPIDFPRNLAKSVTVE